MDEEEPEIVDFVGVVLGRMGKFYNVYRLCMVDGQVSLREVRYGRRRLKKSAIKVAALDLIGISSEITSNDIQFVVDEDEDAA